METNKILTADFLDIIFDGKNKQYGAYDLRKTYNLRLIKAVIITTVFVFVAFLGSVFSKMSNKNANDGITVIDTRLGNVEPEKALPQPPPPLPKQIPPPPQPVNQVRFVAPTIVKDNLVNEDEKIVDLQDGQSISTETVISDSREQIIQAPVEDVASHVIERPKANLEDKILIKVEKEAEFPGGASAWVRYLQKNLDPNVVTDNSAPAGKYQVIIKFIVSKEGIISDVKAETKFGYGLEEEAIKIIKNSPNWKPALQNGTNVSAYRRQPITFVAE